MAGYNDYTSRYKFETDPAKIGDTTTFTGALKGLAGSMAGAAGNLGLKIISDGYGYTQSPEQQQESFRRAEVASWAGNIQPVANALSSGTQAVAPTPAYAVPARTPFKTVAAHTPGAVLLKPNPKVAADAVFARPPRVSYNSANTKGVIPPVVINTAEPPVAPNYDILPEDLGPYQVAGGVPLGYFKAAGRRPDLEAQGIDYNPSDSGYVQNIVVSKGSEVGRGNFFLRPVRAAEAKIDETKAKAEQDRAQAGKLTEETKVVVPLAESEVGYRRVMGRAALTNAEANKTQAGASYMKATDDRAVNLRNSDPATIQNLRYADAVTKTLDRYKEDYTFKQLPQAQQDAIIERDVNLTMKAFGGTSVASKTIIAKSKDGKYVKYSDGTTERVKK